MSQILEDINCLQEGIRKLEKKMFDLAMESDNLTGNVYVLSQEVVMLRDLATSIRERMKEE